MLTGADRRVLLPNINFSRTWLSGRLSMRHFMKAIRCTRRVTTFLPEPIGAWLSQTVRNVVSSDLRSSCTFIPSKLFVEVHRLVHVLKGPAVDTVVSVLLLFADHRRGVDDAASYQKVLQDNFLLLLRHRALQLERVPQCAAHVPRHQAERQELLVDLVVAEACTVVQLDTLLPLGFRSIV